MGGFFYAFAFAPVYKGTYERAMQIDPTKIDTRDAATFTESPGRQVRNRFSVRSLAVPLVNPSLSQ